MLLQQILIAAAMVETLTENVKWVKENNFTLDRIIALVLGIVIAVGAQLDVFAATGIPLFIPYLGWVLTGLLIARGGNFVHDFFKIITAYGTQLKESLKVFVSK